MRLGAGIDIGSPGMLSGLSFHMEIALSQSQLIFPTLLFYAQIFFLKSPPFLPKVIVAVEALPIVLSRKDRLGGGGNRGRDA